MRWFAGLLVVGLGIGAAIADPMPAGNLSGRIRDAKASVADRREAAADLAKRMARDEHAREIAMTVVIDDDPKIREPVILALIDAGKLTKEVAAQVPTRKVLDFRLRQLLGTRKLRAIPVAADCRVTGGTAKGATLECEHRHCGDSCFQHVTRITLTTGARWRLGEVHESRNDHGSCGHCMMVE